jgi:hypothetical protein
MRSSFTDLQRQADHNSLQTKMPRQSEQAQGDSGHTGLRVQSEAVNEFLRHKNAV